MKLRISNVSEREIRCYIQAYIDLNQDYEFLIEAVNRLYRGRFVNLIYDLISGESGMFRKYDDSLALCEEYDVEKIRDFSLIKQILDDNSEINKTCVYITSDDDDRLLDVTYLSEFGKLLDEFQGDRSDLDLYWVLQRIIDIFIIDVLDVIKGDDNDSITFIHMNNKHDDLELVLC